MNTLVQKTKFPEFADRLENVPRSFIRDILKVASSDEIISFAGGLPNKNLFPVAELKDSADRILSEHGHSVLQYSNTEGYLPLKEKIAERYAIKGLTISPENILITNGSQQALDLIAKVLLNEGSEVLIEEPGYLGAIQAFSIYKARFHTVPMAANGPTPSLVNKALVQNPGIRFFYTIPNFQNPSGISYSGKVREEISGLIKQHGKYLIEDDPYGELQYVGVRRLSMANYIPEQCILLGSFSKTVVPSFRIGWIAASKDLMEKLIIVKQASDLHTDFFAQRLIHDFLDFNSFDDHLNKIRQAYKLQAFYMMEAMKSYFPDNVSFTTPEGGMFIWATLPDSFSSLALFERSIDKGVAFVPGDPFYIGKENSNSFRLNFSCSGKEEIYEGIKSISEAIREM